jgi:hypothetical protein
MALSPGSIAAAPELHIPGLSYPPENPEHSTLSIASETNTGNKSQLDSLQLESNQASASHSRTKTKAKTELSFTRVKPNTPAQQSLLTSVLAAQSSSADNPFSELYASVAARGQDTYSLCVYFPHSKTPNKPMELTTQRDASVEEIIGFSLWNYWEERWKPDLDADCSDDDEKKKIRFSAVSWNLRIAEDDGEVDEDFPCVFFSIISSLKLKDKSTGPIQEDIHIQLRRLCHHTRNVCGARCVNTTFTMNGKSTTLNSCKEC